MSGYDNWKTAAPEGEEWECVACGHLFDVGSLDPPESYGQRLDDFDGAVTCLLNRRHIRRSHFLVCDSCLKRYWSCGNCALFRDGQYSI